MWRNLPGPGAERPAGVRLLAISMLALLAAQAGPAQSAPAAPLTVYGQLPNIEDVTISPDGARLAYVTTQGDQRIIAVANVADHKMIGWVKAADTKLRHIEWVDHDNLMIETSLTGSMYGFRREWFLLRQVQSCLQQQGRCRSSRALRKTTPTGHRFDVHSSKQVTI